MSKTVEPALQTKTTPNQASAFKGHIYTMGAAFAGVIFGVLGSMGFVGSYLNSQFAAQTAALDKRIVATAPASVTTDGCYGTSTASVEPTHKVAKAAHSADHAGMVGGRGGDAPAPHGNNGGGSGGGRGGGSSTPFVNQLIKGSISNVGPNSSATINASNEFNYTVTNNNDVNVSNNNNQTAVSGSATNNNNAHGGSSTTGSSDNHSSTATSVEINN